MDETQNHSTTAPQPFGWSIPSRSSREHAEREQLERIRAEREKIQERRAIETLGGIKAYEEFTFDRFPRTWDSNAFDAAFRFHPSRSNLYFWGRSGMGKTHLSIAAAHRFLDEGRAVFVRTVPDLKNEIRQFESQFDYTGKARLIERCANADVLVLHELCRGSVSELLQETLWTILERRFLDRRNGLIVTSNWDLSEVGRLYGGTISRRISDLCGPGGVIRFLDRPRDAAPPAFG